MSSNEQTRKRKHNFKRKVCAWILIVMMICLGLIVFLLLFQVREVNIKGNKYVSKQEVYDWVCEDELSTNSLYLLGKYNLTEPKLMPSMEEVKVSLSNPWTVNVRVKEKQVVGFIIWNEQFVYFDKDGFVLDINQEWWEDVPRIDGIELKKVKKYQNLPVSKENKNVFNNLLDISENLKKYELTPDRIECRDSELYLYFDNKCAILGNRNFSDRIAQISPILEKLGDKSGTLHLETYNEENTTITFTEGELPERLENESTEENNTPTDNKEDTTEGDESSDIG